MYALISATVEFKYQVTKSFVHIINLLFGKGQLFKFFGNFQLIMNNYFNNTSFCDE